MSSDAMVAVFDRGTVTLDVVNLPEPSLGEIDVAITTAAICGSDLHTVLGHRSTPPRTALGHEGVGTITRLGPNTGDRRDVAGAPLTIGDRVVFSMLSSCGECDRCVSGLTMKCRSLLKYGHEWVGTPPYATGTLATHLRLLPTTPVARVPDGLDDAEVVSAGCAVATAAAIVDAAGAHEAGTPVLVFGAGAVGAYAAAMFASLGCAVRVRDPVQDRLALVEQMGVKPDADDGTSFPVVVEASGNAGAFEAAIGSADVGGRIVAAGSVSPGSSSVRFDPAVLVTRRITLAGVHNYTAQNFQWGVDWLHTVGRTLGLERLVSPPFPLTQVAEAFRAMESGAYPRVLVQPDAKETHG